MLINWSCCFGIDLWNHWAAFVKSVPHAWQLKCTGIVEVEPCLRQLLPDVCSTRLPCLVRRAKCECKQLCGVNPIILQPLPYPTSGFLGRPRLCLHLLLRRPLGCCGDRDFLGGDRDFLGL